MKKVITIILGLIIILNTGCGQVSKNVGVDNSDDHGGEAGWEVTEDYAINNSMSSMSNRTEAKNEPIEIQGENSIILRLIAELAPPVYDNEVLQAADIDIHNNYVYVGYNTQGPEKRGGIQVLRYNGSALQVISEMVLFNAEVNAVKIDPSGSKLYLAEAVATDNPAYAEVLELKDHKIIGSLGKVALPSYAGVDIDVSDSHFYVAYGDKNGGIARINKNTYKLENSYALDDIRSIDIEGNSLYVLQGNSAQIQVLSKSTLSPIKALSVESNYDAEAKATLQAEGSVIAYSAGRNGAKIMNTVGSTLITAPVPSGICDSSDAVCNSVTFDDDLFFVANGGAGVSMLQMSNKLQSLSESSQVKGTGSFQVENSSVNMIDYSDGLLFVTAGRGGVKVLKVWEGQPFDIEEKDIIINKKVTVTTKVLGTALTKGEGGPRVPIYMKKKINDKRTSIFGGTNVNVENQSAFVETFELNAGDHYALRAETAYYSYDSDDPPPFVQVLKNGDAMPNYKPFGGQANLEAFIAPYIDSNGKLKLADNQIIVIYELGTRDINSPAADFQDCVLLIEMNK